jgi:hypothetical protein
MPVIGLAHVSQTRQLSSDNRGLGGFDPTDCAKPVPGGTKFVNLTRVAAGV